MPCLFCAIAAGDVPSRQVYADEDAVAFLDIAPWHRGHTLVIPRRHVDDFRGQPAALTEMIPAIGAVSTLLTQRLGCDGINLLSNAGPASGQEVFHLHVHLIPRYAGADAAPGIRGLIGRDSEDLDAVHALLV